MIIFELLLNCEMRKLTNYFEAPTAIKGRHGCLYAHRSKTRAHPQLSPAPFRDEIKLSTAFLGATAVNIQGNILGGEYISAWNMQRDVLQLSVGTR